MSSGARVLVDTSAWVEYLRQDGDSEIQLAVRQALEAGQAVLCDLVVLELWNGAQGKRQPLILQVLEATLDMVPTTEAVWARARHLARSCRSGGLTIPATDLLIAACAQVHDATLVHCDGHYDRLAALEVG